RRSTFTRYHHLYSAAAVASVGHGGEGARRARRAGVDLDWGLPARHRGHHAGRALASVVLLLGPQALSLLLALDFLVDHLLLVPVPLKMTMSSSRWSCNR